MKSKFLWVYYKIINDPEFDVVLDEKKGTHSMRKFATDMAKKRQMMKDWIDLRFWWSLKQMHCMHACIVHVCIHVCMYVCMYVYARKFLYSHTFALPHTYHK